MDTRICLIVAGFALSFGCSRSTAETSPGQATADLETANEVGANPAADTVALADASPLADDQVAADEFGGGVALIDATDAGPDVSEVDGESEVGDIDVGDSLVEASGADASDAAIYPQPDGWFPVKGDAGGDTSWDTADAGDANGGPETVGPCKDVRKRGDMKILQDWCWDPPAHYCSGPEAQAFLFGCRPDFSVCCAFPTSCSPCGWVLCPYVPPGGSLPANAPIGCPTDWTGWKNLSMPGCAPYMPPEDQEFCWDGVPNEWKTPAFHMDGG